MLTRDEQRIVLLVREVDAKRKRSIEAERKASMLRAVIARMQRQSKGADKFDASAFSSEVRSGSQDLASSLALQQFFSG